MKAIEINGEIKTYPNLPSSWENIIGGFNNLSDEEIDTFDEIVQSGTVEQAKLAAKGLYAQYKAANGSSPKLTQGSVTGSSTMPFKSNQELARAMSDPRYKSGDKAYHEEIDRRIAASQNYI